MKLTQRQVLGLLAVNHGEAYFVGHHRRRTGELYYSYHNIHKTAAEFLTKHGLIVVAADDRKWKLTDTGKNVAREFFPVIGD